MKKEITCWTILEIKVKTGTAKEAAAAHTKRRAIEECAETVDGFVYGETVVSKDNPKLMLVICGWENEAAIDEWQKSPVREKQTKDLAPLIDVDFAKENLFQRYHKVEGR